MEIDRIQNEVQHGKKIPDNIVNIWGWESPAGKVRADRKASYFIQIGDITAEKKDLEIGCGAGEPTKGSRKQEQISQPSIFRRIYWKS